jgi:hypothetical protein
LSFLGFYLDGAGVTGGLGFFASAFAMFILPWVMALLCSCILKARFWIRVLFYLPALVIQFVLLFTVVPPGATSETMGMAHRLRREFPPDELRTCADDLRRKFHGGTLAIKAKSQDDKYMVEPSAVAVADSELPNSLQGHFQRVSIQKSPGGGEEQGRFCAGVRNGHHV